MNIEFIILLVLVIVGFTGVFWFLARSRRQEPQQDENVFLMLQNQINEITRTLDKKLGESSELLQRQFGENVKIIGDVREKVARVEEISRQSVNSFEEIRKLQDILQNPKQRGILGEYFLETVLKNVLPPGSYQMQYSFSNKVIVDAAVFVDKRIIPVDSKFSLENYNRILEARDVSEKKRYEAAFINDLKIRIDETSKYVKPEEGTMDFAFMFIPSEAVYYDLLINKVGAVTDDTKNLVHYAGKKKVIVVSPTSFLAYLQTVLQGLKNQKISEQAKEIIKQVENLGRHLGSYEDYMQKLGKNLGTTVNMYNNAYKEFGKIDKDVLRITGEKIGSEPTAIAGPSDDI
ncbi:MAG: hypothetical protein A3C07_02060 [Candidatus Sungbacteria bacterium RIFCSPHIGHO2_02_FULL_47_11]|uniref:DNA recombination protein RmuC n=1 Tax=Candidatus Sungbacteria bacterium RIFCSPHIGHO2_02_FULL_47_11 TaxID=1802270 RepID=A0A1G2KN02_9BACT|nr:MAG: hypothetical protein A3C07_02060 [Candidatus Sungbacteria bacterium RIFCSPHIGHO2_02_FULL_47_11]